MPRISPRLTAWAIVAVLVLGLVAAGVQGGGARPLAVATAAPHVVTDEVPPTAGISEAAATTTVTPSTSAVSAPVASPRRAGTTTTTAPGPRTASSSPLVPAPPTADQPGTYVVRRDGTGLHRVQSVCNSDGFFQWLNATDFAMISAATNGKPVRVNIDGQATPIVLPSVSGRYGGSVPLQSVGSPSADGHRSVTAFLVYGEAGVAIIDFTTMTANVVYRGDNPTPSWSPNGDILLVGPTTTQVIDEHGTTIRDSAPSPISMSGQLSWSPDGRRLLAASNGDGNRTVVMNPRANTIQPVPQIGTGGMNRVAWAGSDRVVIADPGVGHSILPSLHLWHPATGAITPIMGPGWFPAVPRDGQVVAFDDRGARGVVGVASVDGQRRSDLVRVPASLSALPDSWSPDGTWLLLNVCTNTKTQGSLPST